jgi:hypothetical protein
MESKYKLVLVTKGLYLVRRRSDNLMIANLGASYDKSAPWELRFTDIFCNKVELKFKTLAEVREHLQAK